MSGLPLESTDENAHLLILDGKAYDVYKLIQLSSNIEPVEMAAVQLENQLLGEECWEDSEGCVFSPRSLMKAFQDLVSVEAVSEKHSTWINHINKVRDADYSFPILMFHDQVIDGMHRIIHARVDSVESLPVRILFELPKHARYQG